MNIYETLVNCKEASGANAKKEILKECDNTEFKRILKLALDPFVTFGVKKFEFGEPCEHEEGFFYNWNYALNVLSRLQSRDYTGNEALEKILEASANLSSEQQDVFAKILKKDLRCGIGIKTVNAVFPNLISQFEVQLAKPINYEKVTYPVLVEPKLDGIRCMAFVINGSVMYYSRNGKEFLNFDVFDAELLGLSGGKNVVFDGEVTGTSMKGAFKEVTQQARRKSGVDNKVLRYHVFDCMNYHEFKKQRCVTPQLERTGMLREMFHNFEERETFSVRKVKGKVCVKEKSVQKYYEKCISKGYEGVIVKSVDGLYEFKRSTAWQKIKPTDTLDLEVIGIQEGTGKYTGKLGALIVSNNDVKVNIGSGFTDEDRVKYFTEEMIGKVVEVKYDSITDDGSLRFPRFVTVREDK